MSKGNGDDHPMENAQPAPPHGNLGGGEGKPKCGIKKRQFPYTPCALVAGYGTEHLGIGACKYHGGLLNNHNEHAARVKVDMEAKILLEREGLTPVEDPLAQLQMLAAEVVKWKQILGSKIEELDTWTTESLMESEEIRAVIAAYERALDRTNTVLSGMVRLNLEERQQKLSAAWGAIMVELLESVLFSKEIGLDRTQIQTAKAIIAREVPRFAVAPAA